MQAEKNRQANCLVLTNNLTEPTNSRDRQKLEREAIRRAQAGDLWGFEHIYRVHSRNVYGQCFRMLADAAEAEDLTQEVFLRVFRKIKSFRGNALLSTWLSRLTANAVLMHIRRKNVVVVSLDQVSAPDLASGSSCEEPATPDQSGESMADRLYLKAAIAHLPWTWRLVFLLHDVHGYKHMEIARMMRCSVNTSKGILHKAHLRLRAALLGNSEGLCFVPGLAAKAC